MGNIKNIIRKWLFRFGIGKFKKFTFPTIMQCMPTLLAEELISVQPMQGVPSGIQFNVNFYDHDIITKEMKSEIDDILDELDKNFKDLY